MRRKASHRVFAGVVHIIRFVRHATGVVGKAVQFDAVACIFQPRDSFAGTSKVCRINGDDDITRIEQWR